MVKKLNNLKINRRFIKCSKFLLDLFFPSFCVGCGDEGSLLCRKCQKGIITVQAPICPECSKLSEDGRYCVRCRKDKELKGIIVATYYEEGPIKEMIHNFKYNHALELKKVLSDLLVQAYWRHSERSAFRHAESLANASSQTSCEIPHQTVRDDDIKIDIVTFTPLHRRRLAERGFNQAEILAHETARKLKLSCCDALVKTKSTKRQVGLTGQKRRQNLAGVFAVTKSLQATMVAKQSKVESLRGKKILIIDDITTTGTTLNECAKILKSAGAKEVWGLVVARG